MVIIILLIHRYLNILEEIPLLQSTRFCSDKATNLPVLRKCCPSNAAIAENAQQDPHRPYRELQQTHVSLR